LRDQLKAIVADFEAASARLHALKYGLDEEAWGARHGERTWSAAECVEHLNRTSAAFLPLIRGKLAEAPRLTAPRRLRRDPLGFFLWSIMPPPVRLMRVKTSGSFVPVDTEDPDVLCARFDALQAEQIACVTAAEGLAIDKVMLASPFDPRAKYNLYACLGILPRHQHRHLWQAEQAAKTAGAGIAPA